MVEENAANRTLSPEAAKAVEAEIVRIVRMADTTETYASTLVRPYGYKIMIQAVPGFTRARWQEITHREALLPDEAQARVRDQAQANRDLLRQHGRPTCCPECDADNAAALRRQLGLDQVAPVAVDDPDDEEEERTCRCDACDDERCQGDCHTCDDHGCEQCFADHTVYNCCGYCPECSDHMDNDRNDYYCSECNHCSECEHYCNRN